MNAIKIVSLRWKLLLLALLPVLVLGLAVAYSALTVQAKQYRLQLVRAGVQTAAVFGQEILGDFENSARGFADSNLRGLLQQRMNELLKSQLLPIDFAVISNEKNQAVAVFTKAFSAPDVPESAISDPIGTWTRASPEVVAAVRTMTTETLKYRRPSGAVDQVELSSNAPLARDVQAGQKKLLLSAYPIPSGVGTVVLGLDNGAVENQIAKTVTTTLLQLLAVFAVTALLAILFASGLVQRLLGLSGVADRISMGEFQTQVPIKGNDEISSLGESIERLRDSLEDAMGRLARR
jgi:HAMP domain-containing protein